MPTIERVARTDAGLASELRMSVMRLRRRLTAERHPDNPLSSNSMAVLAALHRLGEMTVGELAVYERVRPPSMTRTVNCLERGGYVVRRADENDRRLVLVAISERGAETLRADRRRRDEWLTRQMRELSADERATLRKAAPILERLARAE